jgi:uracil-DNA glycosylase family 4
VDLEALNRQIIDCRKCPRLVAWRETVARQKRRAYADWEYWGKPVPGFGDPAPEILVVGLAPGAHGSNRTGRQFTGDASGRFLFPALYRAGFASQPDASSREDGLRLRDLYLTAACRCAPPANKPTAKEFANCRPYLESEISLLEPKVIVCLGRSAFDAVLRLHALRIAQFPFRHGAAHKVPSGTEGVSRWLVCSYHPSQQNTRTGKLTEAMFEQVWQLSRELVDSA